MKKFTMLGASLVMLLVATACMSSAAKMQKNEAAKNNAEIMAIGEVSTGGIAKDESDALLLVETKTAATEIKTGYAMEVAGILPDETVLVTKGKRTI